MLRYFLFAIPGLSSMVPALLLAQCTQTYVGDIDTDGRVQLNGVWYQFTIPVPCTKIDYFSTGSCDSGKSNCDGQDYTWSQLIVFNSFSVDVTVAMQTVHATVEHVNNHYDNLWTPHGYTRIGTADFSKNCHGYTFNKDCWVLPGSNSLDIVINDGGNVCFPISSRSQGKYILLDDRSHSCKMTGEVCEININEEIFYLDTIVEIINKDGPSALYKKTGACYDEVATTGPYIGGFDIRKDP